jgi:hypothetical protein
VAEAVSRRLSIPTLFITRGARDFVDRLSGSIKVRSVLVPVDFLPAPIQAIKDVLQFGRLLAGADIIVHLLHVGRSAPSLSAASFYMRPLPPVMLRSGDVVTTIIDIAREFDVDFIGMPTAGHEGVLDTLRGSTTERVIRRAPCPVLALPVRSP